MTLLEKPIPAKWQQQGQVQVWRIKLKRFSQVRCNSITATMNKFNPLPQDWWSELLLQLYWPPVMIALIFALCIMIKLKTDRSSDYLHNDQTILQHCAEHCTNINLADLTTYSKRMSAGLHCGSWSDLFQLLLKSEFKDHLIPERSSVIICFRTSLFYWPAACFLSHVTH